jgi:hypothetical protein
MKWIITVFVVFLFFAISSSTTSCTKSNATHDSTTVVQKDTLIVRDTVYQHLKNPIIGLWIGTYKVNGDAVDSFYFSFDILANNSVITTAIGATNNSTSTAGPWQLNGINFTATVTTLNGGNPLYVQAITAVYDSTAGTLSGVVNVTQGSGLNGNFLLFRAP